MSCVAPATDEDVCEAAREHVLSCVGEMPEGSGLCDPAGAERILDASCESLQASKADGDEGLLCRYLGIFCGSAPEPPPAPASVCTEVLATVTVPERSYQIVDPALFDTRLYFYVPEIQSRLSGEHDAFPLHVVEGVYGRPFIVDSGSMDEAVFERIRVSLNIRVTTVQVVDSQPAFGELAFNRESYIVEVADVATSTVWGDTVTVRICR